MRTTFERGQRILLRRMGYASVACVAFWFWLCGVIYGIIIAIAAWSS